MTWNYWLLSLGDEGPESGVWFYAPDLDTAFALARGRWSGSTSWSFHAKSRELPDGATAEGVP